MGDLNVQVLHGFGVKPRRVVKEKSSFICSTDKGCKLLRKSFDSCDSVMFQHEIKEQLWARGFRRTDRFTLSTEGKPYVLFEDGVYTMTDALALKAASFADNSVFEKAARQAAAFHEAARGLTFSGRLYYTDTHFLETYAKNISELNSIKKRLGSQKRLSDFDVLFLKNYGFYMARLEMAADLLGKTNLERYARRAKEEGTICHGLLKEENMPLDVDGVYIVNFSRAAIGYSLLDLCGLIQRYIKQLSGRTMPVRSVIRLYDSQNRLESEEIRILYPLLLYPHKFIRICGQYYSKKRT